MPESTSPQRLVLADVVRVRDALLVFLQHLLFGIAEHFAQRAVDLQPAAGNWIHQRHADRPMNKKQFAVSGDIAPGWAYAGVR